MAGKLTSIQIINQLWPYSRNLFKYPPRIQWFLLRLQPYSIEINYKKGTEQVVADTLSRATENITQQTEIPEEEVKAFVDSVVNAMDATPKKLQEIRENKTKMLHSVS